MNVLALVGLWAAALSLVGVLWVVARLRGRGRGDDEAPTRGAAGFATMPFTGVTVGDEVEVVVMVAGLLARSAERGRIVTADFLRASLGNPTFRAALERAGISPERAHAELAALAPPAEAEPAAPGEEPVLDETLDAALERAVLRAGHRLQPVELRDALRTLAGVDAAGRWLADARVALERVVDGPLCEPRPGCVYLINDPVTTMAAIVDIAMRAFELDEVAACYVMATVHLRGFAALGPFAPEVRDDLLARARAAAAELGAEPRLSTEAPDVSGWPRDVAKGKLPP